MLRKAQHDNSVFDRTLEFKLPKHLKLKNYNVTLTRPAPAWMSAIAGVLVLVLAVNFITYTPTQFAQGAYTTSTTDADGIAHLGNNTVNDTSFYDTTQDSSPETQQQLGIDPNWKNGVSRQSYAVKHTAASGHYTDYGDIAAMDGASKLTLEGWVNFSSLSTDFQGIFYKGSAYTNDVGILTGGTGAGSATALFIRVGDGNGSNNNFGYTGNILAVNTWYHIAFVYDGTQSTNATKARVFVNGTEQSLTFNGGITIPTTTQSAATNFRTGSYTTGTIYFSGIIDEVRASSIPRYTTTFNPERRFKEDSSTIGLWHFDEGTGTSANDSSTNGNNGTLTNTPIWVTGANAIMDGYDGSKGYQNKSGAGNITLADRSTDSNDKAYELRGTGSNSLSFDGSNDRVEIADTTTLEPSGSYTLESWIKTSASPGVDNGITGYQSIAGKGFLVTANGYGLFVDDGAGAQGGVAYAPCFQIREGASASTACGNSAINDGKWHHIAAVRDETNNITYMYVDGTQQESHSGTNITTQADDEKFSIGSRHWQGGGADEWRYHFNGTIDEVRLSTNIRYSSSFTPQRRFATDATTAALYHLDEGANSTTCNGSTGQYACDSSGNNLTGTLGATSTSGEVTDPTWAEGIASVSATDTTSQNWALPNYAYRKRLQVATGATALDAGDGIETTENRGTIITNNQSRPDGKDWRMMYQPSDSTRSLSFDGTADFVASTNSSPLQLTTGTVEAWIKTSGAGSSYRAVVTKRNAYGLFLKDDVLMTYDWGGVADRSTGVNLADNQWHHVAMTFQSGVTNGTKIYVDGILKLTTTITVSAQDETVEIGRGGSGAATQLFTGKIDEARISNSIRYTGNFAPNTTPFVPDSNTKGLWHLDEGSGQIAVDNSGNENNGTLGATSASSTDDPSWSTDGKVSTTQEVPRFIPHGHALDFDGSTDYVNVLDNNSLDLTSAVTIAAWIKPTSVSTEKVIVSKQNNYTFQLTNSTGKLRFYNGAAHDDTGAAIAANVWTHVAVVVGGGKVRFYQNGIQTSSATLGGSLTANTNPLNIGFYDGGSADHRWAGIIDDVRLYSQVLSETSIKQVYNNAAHELNGLVSWWALDDGSGQTLSDSFGGLNGTLGATSGSSTDDPTWVTNGGKADSTNQTQFKVVAPVAASPATNKDYYIYYGNSNENGNAQSYNSYGLKFDGTNDYVSINDHSSLDLTTAATIAFWYNRSSGQYVNVSKSNASNNISYGLEIWSDNLAYLTVSGNGSTTAYAGSSSTITASGWNLLVGVYNGSTLTLYHNGSAIASTTTGSVPVSLYNSNSPLNIGKETNTGGTTYYTNGQIGDVRVYGRALSASEVSALYSNTPTVSTANLAGYWKLDDSTPAGTTTTDSSGNANTGTLTGFDFNASSNWVVNTNLKGVATEPSQSVLVTERESPIFFEWRDASGAWPSDRSQTFQLTTGEQQFGSNTVYVKFNPTGVYSRHDYYRITSWAIEAFSTSAPQRGRKRAFPDKANIIDTAGGLDIIDASTNKVWMRYALGLSTLLGATNAPQQVTAKNGRIYVASANGLFEVQLDLDDAHEWLSTGNASFAGNIADRNDAVGYGTPGGSALANTAVNDVSVTVVSNKNYVAVATDSGMSVIQHASQYDANNSTPSGSAIYDYARVASTDDYNDVVLTSGGELYGSNETQSSLDRYDNVHSDIGDQTTSADRNYSTSTTPALRNGTINDLSVTESTSLADDGTSNSVAVAHNSGVDVIHEHTTQSSGKMKYFAKSGTTGNSWSSKQYGSAAKFDGGDVIIATSDIDATELTLSTWVKFDQISGCQSFITKGSGTTGSDYIWTQGWNGSTCGNNYISLYAAGNWHNFAYTFSSDTWYHIAVTYSDTGNAVEMYVNGTSLGTSSETGALANSASAPYIAKQGTANDNYVYGFMDDLRIYNTALSSSSIANLASSSPDACTTSCKLWYQFEGFGSDQTIGDSSGNGNTGTFGSTTAVESNDPKIVSPAIAGSSDKATAVGMFNPTSGGTSLNFDGSGDYITVADSSANSLTGDFTLAAWINPSDLSGTDYKGIVGKYGTGAPEANKRAYQLAVNNGTDKLRLLIDSSCTGGVNKQMESTTSVTAGTWQHAAFVYDSNGGSSSVTLYLNGTADGTSSGASVPTSIADCDEALWIGITNSTTTTASSFPGKIDDVRIYNRALSAGEIATMYNSKSANNTFSNLVAHYKLDVGVTRNITGNKLTVDDASGNNGYGRLMNGSTDSPAADGKTNGPTFTSGSPLKDGRVLWVGTNGASNDDGTMTAISLDTDKQITAYTATSSGLPDLDVTSLSLGRGGLALVGTEVGAWNPGMAGVVVDDTATSPATAIAPVRSKSGTIRSKSGTIRVRGS